MIGSRDKPTRTPGSTTNRGLQYGQDNWKAASLSKDIKIPNCTLADRNLHYFPHGGSEIAKYFLRLLHYTHWIADTPAATGSIIYIMEWPLDTASLSKRWATKGNCSRMLWREKTLRTKWFTPIVTLTRFCSRQRHIAHRASWRLPAASIG